MQVCFICCEIYKILLNAGLILALMVINKIKIMNLIPSFACILFSELGVSISFSIQDLKSSVAYR